MRWRKGKKPIPPKNIVLSLYINSRSNVFFISDHSASTYYWVWSPCRIAVFLGTFDIKYSLVSNSYIPWWEELCLSEICVNIFEIWDEDIRLMLLKMTYFLYNHNLASSFYKPIINIAENLFPKSPCKFFASWNSLIIFMNTLIRYWNSIKSCHWRCLSL